LLNQPSGVLKELAIAFAIYTLATLLFEGSGTIAQANAEANNHSHMFGNRSVRRLPCNKDAGVVYLSLCISLLVSVLSRCNLNTLRRVMSNWAAWNLL